MASHAMKKAVNAVTDVVFPAPKNVNEVQKQQLLQSGQEYVTNLPLQMSLYFNVFFSPLWFISSIVTLEAKYTSLSTLYRIVVISILVIMFVIEVIRVYLGYMGNLMERVPELAGFWLLTLILQVPMILFLLFNTGLNILPLERAMNIVMALFILFEAICGYFAIRTMVNYQVTKFHLRDFDRIPDDVMYQEGVEPEGRFKQL